MGSFKKFKTREGSNKGAKMPIMDTEGKDSGESLTVLGVDSDAFQKANRRMRRTLLAYLEEKGDLKAKDDEAYAELTLRQQRELQASLVIGWSFEEEFTQANVVELFTDAPYIADQADQFASKRGQFVSA